MNSEISVGDVVRDRKGIRYKVLAVGSLTAEGEHYGVAEVEVIEDHIDDPVSGSSVVTLHGTKSLRYMVDLYPERREYPIDMTFRFQARVEAGDAVQARALFRKALYDALAWDGDQEAPGPLAEMTVTPVTVRRGVAVDE